MLAVTDPPFFSWRAGVSHIGVLSLYIYIYRYICVCIYVFYRRAMSVTSIHCRVARAILRKPRPCLHPSHGGWSDWFFHLSIFAVALWRSIQYEFVYIICVIYLKLRLVKTRNSRGEPKNIRKYLIIVFGNERV